MVSKSVTIGHLNFMTKGEATAFFQKMLYAYAPGEKVSLQDFQILSDALKKHPDAAQKIGVGVADFYVENAEFNTRCFWVTRTDGSTEKFSFRSCFG